MEKENGQVTRITLNHNPKKNIRRSMAKEISKNKNLLDE